MRRPVLALAALALALPAVPALASDEPVLAPCANPSGLPVLAAGAAALSGTVASPSLVGEAEESVRVLLDLAGAPVGKTASVTGSITWTVPTNDYDLRLSAGSAVGESEGFQPLDPAEETTSVGRVAHCTTVTLTVVDFLAPVAVDTVEYELSAR